MGTKTDLPIYLCDSSDSSDSCDICNSCDSSDGSESSDSIYSSYSSDSSDFFFIFLFSKLWQNSKSQIVTKPKSHVEHLVRNGVHKWYFLQTSVCADNSPTIFKNK